MLPIENKTVSKSSEINNLDKEAYISSKTENPKVSPQLHQIISYRKKFTNHSGNML